MAASRPLEIRRAGCAAPLHVGPMCRLKDSRVRANSLEQTSDNLLCTKGYCADGPCIACIWAAASVTPFFKSSKFMHGVIVILPFVSR
jgi:hypothetical protein